MPGHLSSSAKFLAYSMEKVCDFRAMVIRASFLVLIIASLSLVLHLSFSGETPVFWLPECAPVAEKLNSSPTNISHILFGIGGSAKTWPNRRRYVELWWKRNITRGYLWLDREPTGLTLPDGSIPYRVSEDWTGFRYAASQNAVRLSRIVLESFRLGSANVRWFVMGDDDTVFFPDNLVSVLAKYDHRRMYYIGASSESLEQNTRHSFDMAFGGGGFAVSHALAAELAKRLDGCIDRYYKFYGSDERVWACVSEIGLTLTKEPGFHQMDIRGDASGLLAAHPAVPLVSLHHLDYLKPLFPTRTREVSLKMFFNAYRTDPPRMLQQSFCYDRRGNLSVAVSWGYTVRVDPLLTPVIDMERPLPTFKTWRSWSDGPFIFNTRVLGSDPCQQPAVFFMDRVSVVGERASLTRYKRFVPPKGKMCKRDMMGFDKIVVSAGMMDPEVWKMAPRRDCCEIARKEQDTLGLMIRSCRDDDHERF